MLHAGGRGRLRGGGGGWDGEGGHVGPPSLHPACLLVGLCKARVAGSRHGANARGPRKKTTGEGWGVGAHDCMYSTVQYIHKHTTRHRRPASCLQPPAVATGGCQHTIPHPPPQSQKVKPPVVTVSSDRQLRHYVRCRWPPHRRQRAPASLARPPPPPPPPAAMCR